MFISRHTLKWTKTCRSSGDFPHAHTAHFLLNRHTDPVIDRSNARAEPSGGPLPRMPPGTGSIALVLCLQWDGGFRHMAGMPGILCQPAFRALSGRMTQVFDHLGRGHRRGGVQVHRAPSFLGTGHTIILSFSLQKTSAAPYRLARSRIRCKLRCFLSQG